MFAIQFLTTEHMRTRRRRWGGGGRCRELGSCIPLNFPTNLGQKARLTIRAKSPDFRASGGENIRAQETSAPPPPPNGIGTVYAYCTEGRCIDYRCGMYCRVYGYSEDNTLVGNPALNAGVIGRYGSLLEVSFEKEDVKFYLVFSLGLWYNDLK